MKGFAQSLTAGKGRAGLNSPSSPCPGTEAPKTRRDRITLLPPTYSSLPGSAFLGEGLGGAALKHSGSPTVLKVDIHGFDPAPGLTSTWGSAGGAKGIAWR